jgi:hypothetical protein
MSECASLDKSVVSAISGWVVGGTGWFDPLLR